MPFVLAAVGTILVINYQQVTDFAISVILCLLQLLFTVLRLARLAFIHNPVACLAVFVALSLAGFMVRICGNFPRAEGVALARYEGPRYPGRG